MCQGVPILANNTKAVYGKKTNSHSTTEKQLKIDGDKYRKFEWLWWEKKLQQVHYDRVAEDILAKISLEKSTALAKDLVKKNFNTQDNLAKWLRDVPDEWDKLLDPKFKTLAKKVNPKLLIYQDKIAKFKKTPIEKYNPYTATKLPSKDQLSKLFYNHWQSVGQGVWQSVRESVGQGVWQSVRESVGQGVWQSVRQSVGEGVGQSVRKSVWQSVWEGVGQSVRKSVWQSVREQEYIASYWGIKVALNLPIHHWFFDFLKLGVMIIFVQGKVKVFGKKGIYLGEYDEKELFS